MEDQLRFYYYYLRDIVPQGVTVQHCPTGESQTREEIQLLTPSGGLFMSGLVSIDRSTTNLESVAGSEAYTYWLDGEYVPGDQDWRFFTAHTNLTFLRCLHRNGNEWEADWGANPMNRADEAAVYLQLQYDMLRYH